MDFKIRDQDIMDFKDVKRQTGIFTCKLHSSAVLTWIVPDFDSDINSCGYDT